MAEPFDPGAGDGLPALLRAASREQGRRLALLALCGLGVEHAADVLARGFDAFLPAPADPDALLDLTRRLVTR